MSEASKKACSCNLKDSDASPPQLTVGLPSIQDVTTTLKKPDLPVDVLLVTVKECEFLSCYNELKDPYRCYYQDVGYVYFNNVQSHEEKVKVALLRCNEGSIGPSSSLIAVKNTAAILQPKAVISVGACSGLNPDKTKLGDVVVSAKLTTYASKVVTSDREQSAGMSSHVSRLFSKIIPNCADGWQAPLKNPEDRQVKVHCNGEFLSGPEEIRAQWRRKELADRHPLAAVVEMEGEGVFTAAFDSQLEWLIVKGIADFADGEQATAESWEACASMMAASLVSHILSDPSVFRTHYSDGLFEAQHGSARKRKLTENHAAENMLSSLQNLRCDADQVRNKTNLPSNLRTVAAKEGFLVSDNQGSGNCLFYALSEQLKSVKGIQISHKELRNTLVQFLRENANQRDGTSLFNFVSGYPSWREYLQSMAKDGTWGDHVVLFAAANYFQTAIRIISSLDREIIVHSEHAVADTTPLVLGHIHELHYVSLQPIKVDGLFEAQHDSARKRKLTENHAV